MNKKYNVTIEEQGKPTVTIYGLTIHEGYAEQDKRPGSRITFRPQLRIEKYGKMYGLDFVTKAVGMTLRLSERLQEVEELQEKLNAMSEGEFIKAIS